MEKQEGWFRMYGVVVDGHGRQFLVPRELVIRRGGAEEVCEIVWPPVPPPPPAPPAAAGNRPSVQAPLALPATPAAAGSQDLCHRPRRSHHRRKREWLRRMREARKREQRERERETIKAEPEGENEEGMGRELKPSSVGP